jgi:hypothetical protein
MKRFLARKRTAVLGILALLAISGAAFAYWTTSGTGQATATTGGGHGVTVNPTVPAGMYPGAPAADINFSITNPGPGTAYVTSVSASITNADVVGNGSGPVPCDASDFAITQAPSAINQDLAVGSTSFTGAQTPKITMVNKPGQNQNDCKNASVTVHIDAS